MGAVARAARAGGAHTVGVIPDALRLREVADLDADELVVTPDMRSRKGEMDRRADAFLVLPGGMGTLEELLEIWTSRSLGMHTKPIVVLDPDGVFDPLREQMARFVEGGFAHQAAVDQVAWATDVATAFDLLGSRMRTRVPFLACHDDVTWRSIASRPRRASCSWSGVALVARASNDDGLREETVDHGDLGLPDRPLTADGHRRAAVPHRPPRLSDGGRRRRAGPDRAVAGVTRQRPADQ